ncbi:PDR/VanB family oxidoreductase [Leeia aquatica]|uniref:Oxidoreductase n=1 Tax=Leeia aquatica TaxID=2725557 RepID=A0A847RX97_9NEIS|nr:PDR/VanB family oxidoreductase [Leeia aquatica]NLR74381.1 oxidoreductase [Leeia aquatica]
MKLIVQRKTLLATDVVQLTLVAADASPLPGFTAGAHLTLHSPVGERRYSLTSLPTTREHYQICVQRAQPGRGGSDWIHTHLQVGDEVTASGPYNAFPLQPDAPHTVLLAGGIGVTPFFGMVDALSQAGRSFEVHYAVQSVDRLLLPDQLGPHRHTYVKAHGERLDLESLLQQAPAGSAFYVCGPHRMLEAVKARAAQLGLPAVVLHMESFGAARRPQDQPVALTLTRTGVTVLAQPGETLLDVAQRAGAWASYECLRGECGACYAEVTGGEVDHRDVCLTPAQRAKGMCPCVSWATGPALQLDL